MTVKTEVQEQPTTTNGAQPAANPDPAATSSNYTELVGTLVKQRDPQSRFISNEKLIITRQGADGTPTTHMLLAVKEEFGARCDRVAPRIGDASQVAQGDTVRPESVSIGAAIDTPSLKRRIIHPDGI